MNIQQRSTKGASKQRRELINSEIIKLRDLLPATENVRSHLSQLQVMSLCNTYIAKCNFFESTISPQSCLFEDLSVFLDSQYPDLSELLPGFLMMITTDGKVLYLSENVIEYLGHSMVDIVTHIDSFYDLIDRRDHDQVKEVLVGMKSGFHSQDEWSFTCRMGLTRKFHQNLGFYDQKSMLVRGYCLVPHFNPEFMKPVFVALCTPRLKAAVASEPGILFDTMIFESVHELDMKYRDINSNGEVHLGYSLDEIRFRSWYELIHPEDSSRAVAAHRSLLCSESQSWSPLFIRIQRKDGHLNWMSVLMKKVKNLNNSGKEVIVCLNQIVRERDLINECEAGRMSSSYGQEFLSCQSPKETDSLPSSGAQADFGANKCSSSREEVLRRLKRKMEMNEMKRMKAFLPSENASRSQSSSPEKSSSGFKFEYPSKKLTASRSESTVMNLREKIMSATARRDSSSSSSVSSVFQSNSPFTPGSSASSPSSQGLSVMCPTNDVNVTSMPTPKFLKASSYSDCEVFETGFQEEVEVANIVEEMLEASPLYDDSRVDRGFRKEKRGNELPVLCPGTVDDFFREFEAAPLSSGLKSVLGLEDCHFAPLGVNGNVLSAGQTLVDVNETRYSPFSNSGEKMEKNWAESNMQAYVLGIGQSLIAGDMCDQGVSVYRHVLDYDDTFQPYQDHAWNGFSNFLMED